MNKEKKSLFIEKVKRIFKETFKNAEIKEEVIPLLCAVQEGYMSYNKAYSIAVDHYGYSYQKFLIILRGRRII